MGCCFQVAMAKTIATFNTNIPSGMIIQCFVIGNVL